jgi:hypothetical protein
MPSFFHSPMPTSPIDLSRMSAPDPQSLQLQQLMWLQAQQQQMATAGAAGMLPFAGLSPPASHAAPDWIHALASQLAPTARVQPSIGPLLHGSADAEDMPFPMRWAWF